MPGDHAVLKALQRLLIGVNIGEPELAAGHPLLNRVPCGPLAWRWHMRTRRRPPLRLPVGLGALRQRSSHDPEGLTAQCHRAGSPGLEARG